QTRRTVACARIWQARQRALAQNLFWLPQNFFALAGFDFLPERRGVLLHSRIAETLSGSARRRGGNARTGFGQCADRQFPRWHHERQLRGETRIEIARLEMRFLMLNWRDPKNP